MTVPPPNPIPLPASRLTTHMDVPRRVVIPSRKHSPPPLFFFYFFASPRIDARRAILAQPPAGPDASEQPISDHFCAFCAVPPQKALPVVKESSVTVSQNTITIPTNTKLICGLSQKKSTKCLPPPRGPCTSVSVGPQQI